MENKKRKLWKKILLIVLAIFIVFLIYVIRNFIIISNILNISKEYSTKTNYIANVYSLQDNSVNILKSYNKDGKYLSLITNKVNSIDDVRKLTVYKNADEGIAIIETEGKKTALVTPNVLGGIQVVTFSMFCSDNELNVLQKLLLSTITRISSEKCNNKECFYVEFAEGWKMWVDKENGTIIREINGGFVTERSYEFDTVKDEDIVKPDISDCEIQK